MQPGTYAFRVYADISDDTLFTHRRQMYYFWAETILDPSGQREGTYCRGISNLDTGWWYPIGNSCVAEDYTGQEFVLLYEGNYVIGDTDGLLGENFEGKDELLSTFWRLTLKNVYDGSDEMLSLNPEYHISACIQDFTKYSIPDVYVDLFYNWSIRQAGGAYCWGKDGIYFTWMIPEKFDFDEGTYRDSVNESAVLMDGTVTKSWNEEFQKIMDNEARKRSIPYLCGTMLEIMGQRYLDQTGSIYGDLKAELYLTDSDFSTGLLDGEFWLCASEEKPVRVLFGYQEPCGNIDASYTFTIDEESELTAEITENAYLRMEIDLTTEKPKQENADLPDGKTGDCEGEWEGFPDEYLPRRYPALDYDGDGLTDRIYKRYVKDGNQEQMYLYTGSGRELYLGNALDHLRFGYIRKLDVTGDGIPELIYHNPVVGMRGPMADYYGIWTVGSEGWERIPFSDMKAEKERLAGLFPNVPLKVERLSDGKLRIAQTDRQVETILELKPELIDYFWPASDGRAIYTVLDNNVKMKMDGEHEGMYGTVKIGQANLSGKWMYQDGGWRITEFYLNIDDEILN